jgi:hypothetical protein
VRRIVSAPNPEQAPPVDWNAYEVFARDALVALSAGDHPDAITLRQQLSRLVFAEMDYTGAGFFLTLVVPTDAPLLNRSGIIGDLHAEAPDHEGPLGLLLFVEGGAARTLEAFAYGDWPQDIARFKFQYVSWKPHADGKGASAVNVAHRELTSMWSD